MCESYVYKYGKMLTLIEKENSLQDMYYLIPRIHTYVHALHEESAQCFGREL